MTDDYKAASIIFTVCFTNTVTSDVRRFRRVVVMKMGFKFPKLVIINFYTQIMYRRFLVDTMYVCTQVYVV